MRMTFVPTAMGAALSTRTMRSASGAVTTRANAVARAQECGVREALPWLEKVIHFANLAKDSVKQ